MTGPTHEDLLRTLTRDHPETCDCDGCRALRELERDRRPT